MNVINGVSRSAFVRWYIDWRAIYISLGLVKGMRWDYYDLCCPPLQTCFLFNIELCFTNPFAYLKLPHHFLTPLPRACLPPFHTISLYPLFQLYDPPFVYIFNVSFQFYNLSRRFFPTLLHLPHLSSRFYTLLSFTRLRAPIKE